jgi:hypothetical protein
MTWPARTNLAPTLVLFAVAASNFLASVAVMAMSFKRSFRRPIRSRDAYRIFAGCFGVVLWATALIAFNLLDRASKASLGRYACMNRNVMSNGRYQYRAVCSEQVMHLVIAHGRRANASSGTCLLPRNWRRLRRSRHAIHPRGHRNAIREREELNNKTRRESLNGPPHRRALSLTTPT